MTVNGGRPSSLPTQIPGTIEGVTGAQVEERINATDSGDALKYFPCLNVRKLLAAYHVGERWTTTLGARYSGKQFGTLDNSDPHGATYTGGSTYFVTDVRVRYRIDGQWSTPVGIDNLNNARYWAHHPYTQRTLLAELKFDL